MTETLREENAKLRDEIRVLYDLIEKRNSERTTLRRELHEVQEKLERQALRQRQQSDLIECYTQEGIRQRKMGRVQHQLFSR